MKLSAALSQPTAAHGQVLCYRHCFPISSTHSYLYTYKECPEGLSSKPTIRPTTTAISRSHDPTSRHSLAQSSSSELYRNIADGEDMDDGNEEENEEEEEEVYEGNMSRDNMSTYHKDVLTITPIELERMRGNANAHRSSQPRKPSRK